MGSGCFHSLSLAPTLPYSQHLERPLSRSLPLSVKRGAVGFRGQFGVGWVGWLGLLGRGLVEIPVGVGASGGVSVSLRNSEKLCQLDRVALIFRRANS